MNDIIVWFFSTNPSNDLLQITSLLSSPLFQSLKTFLFFSSSLKLVSLVTHNWDFQNINFVFLKIYCSFINAYTTSLQKEHLTIKKQKKNCKNDFAFVVSCTNRCYLSIFCRKVILMKKNGRKTKLYIMTFTRMTFFVLVVVTWIHC